MRNDRCRRLCFTNCPKMRMRVDWIGFVSSEIEDSVLRHGLLDRSDARRNDLIDAQLTELDSGPTRITAHAVRAAGLALGCEAIGANEAGIERKRERRVGKARVG